MSPDDFTAWMQRCGFRTNVEAAAALDVTPTAVSLWRNKQRKISRQTARQCRDAEELAARRAGQAENLIGSS